MTMKRFITLASILLLFVFAHGCDKASNEETKGGKTEKAEKKALKKSESEKLADKQAKKANEKKSAEKAKRLEKQRSEEEKRLQETLKIDIPQPKKPEPRFKKDVLINALNRAIKIKGLKGEVVTSDCTEFPCVVAGRIDGRQTNDIFNEMIDTPPMKAYRDDIPRIMSGTFQTKTGELDEKKRPIRTPIFHFAFHFMPDNFPQEMQPYSEAIQMRASYRASRLLNKLIKESR